jgi:hypothetical protein
MSEFNGSITPSQDVSGEGEEGNVADGIRMWDLLHMLEHNLRQMSREELQGALLVLGPLSAYLNRIHFEQRREMNQKSFVKTIEELFEIGMEIDIHGGFVSSGEDSE